MVGSQRITLSFSVNWLFLILIIVVGLIGGYVYWPEHRHLVVFIGTVLAGAGASLAAINALDARVAQLHQSRAMTALDFAHRWTAPAFFHARKAGREALQHFKGKSLAQQKAYLDEDPNRLSNLLDVLNFFETVSVAIRMTIADEEMLKRWFRSVVNEYWHAAEEFVKNRRAERGNARLLSELEWLFNRWNS